MNRRLFFYPAAVGVVWAQQADPTDREAKKALEARAQKFYQFMVEKKYRQAEALVAEESRDDYYAGNKPDIKGFEILRSELKDAGQTAIITIKSKTLVLMMGAGAQIFEMPAATYWKIENGEWCWYIPEEVKHQTPFGKMKGDDKAGGSDRPDERGRAPEFGAMVQQVTIDKTSVTLNAEAPSQIVVIENKLPGPIDLRIDPHAETIRGLTGESEQIASGAGEAASVQITWNGKDPVMDAIEVVAFPLNRTFRIQITAK